MARALMTSLAEKWRTYLQKRRLSGTMRIVTIRAVLGDRLVFPQKWPAVFSVAGRAGFSDRVLHELRRGSRTVGRMAGGTGHRPFE